MKKYILLILSVFALIDSFGQKTDSIKYANGYLYYHDYGSGEPIVLLSGGPGASWQQEEEVGIELSKKYRAIILEQRVPAILYPCRLTRLQ
jgi:proline iminopeptidase